jgi:hypothetical protein
VLATITGTDLLAPGQVNGNWAVVYAARSGTACGETVRIIRFRSDDPNTGTEIAALPAGRDAFSGWARTRPNGSVDYLYERVVCGNRSRDLYRINDPT